MTGAALEIVTVLHPGRAEAAILKLHEPLSFWGGFDPRDGRILDSAHPQHGESVTGRILAMPGSRGSAGTPAGIAEAIRRGVGPVAIMLLRADVNIAIGAQVAAHLYEVDLPVVLVTQRTFDNLRSDTVVLIDGCRETPVSPTGHTAS